MEGYIVISEKVDYMPCAVFQYSETSVNEKLHPLLGSYDPTIQTEGLAHSSAHVWCSISSS